MGANQFTENSLTGHDIPAVCGVYMITDKVTDKTYIGASCNIRTRAVQHFYNMQVPEKRGSAYSIFSATYLQYGSTAFVVSVLEVCDEASLHERELFWITKLRPSENTHSSPVKAKAYTEEERRKRSERTRKLWADPVYRSRAVEARKGNSFSKGYKCTPTQVENRKRAARISNVRRNYGTGWKEEYIRRYPEHIGDLDAY